MKIVAIALMALMATSPVAAQQTEAVDALRARLEAAALQMDADLESAAAALDRLAVESIEIRRSRVLTPVEREVHVRLFLLRGRAHLQLLSNDKAEESFRELLRIAPQFAGELAPLEQQLVDGVRQKDGGVLEVTSTVREARVLIDGVEAGVIGDAPVRAALIAGTYEVRLERPRYATATGRATVVAGQTMTISDLTPVRNVPPMALLSDRDGVDVMTDAVGAGQMVKLSTLRGQMSPEESAAIDRYVALARLDPQTAAGMIVRRPPVDRTMTVRFHRDCFVDETRQLALTSAFLDTLDVAESVAWLGDAAVVRLQPDIGTLRIASTPSDADVLLDGQLVGRTPFEREVCAGAHRVRIRHRIGSYNVAATVTRGRTEAIDVPLKPDVAFLGAVDGDGRAIPEVAAIVDRALAKGLTSYHLASRQELPPAVTPWSDALTAQLIVAVTSGDRDAIARLQKQASVNYEAPVLLCAVRRAGAAAVDLVLFWTEHAHVDRLTVEGLDDASLARAVERLNAPADVGDLVSRHDIGLRVAETALLEAPLLVVSVQAGSAADLAGIKAGDTISAVDRAPATAAQLADAIAARKPGEHITLQIVGTTTAAREVSVAVQRVTQRGPVFDAAIPANTLIARLTARSLVTTAPAERDLLAFNLAATYMRVREWRRALGLLESLPNLPRGDGSGPGMAKYLRGRCHEELGERDQAIAMYKEAAAFGEDVAADDGATVATLARQRLAALTAGGR